MTWASWQHVRLTRRRVGARWGARERMHIASLHKLSVCICRVWPGVGWSRTPGACRARAHALANTGHCAQGISAHQPSYVRVFFRVCLPFHWLEVLATRSRPENIARAGACCTC